MSPQPTQTPSGPPSISSTPNAQPPRWGEYSRVGLAMAVLFVAVIAAFGVLSWFNSRDTPRGCDLAAQATTPITDKLQSQSLKIRDASTAQIQLGDSLGVGQAFIILDTDQMATVPSPTAVQVSVDSFRRDTDPDVSAAVHATAEFRSRRSAILHICVQRAGTGSDGGQFTVDPGMYTGSITVVDPRLPVTTIPVTVTLAYPNWAVVLTLWCLVSLAASLYAYVLRKDPGTPDPHPVLDPKPLIAFWGSPIGLVSTIVGAAAAYGVYNAVYLGNPAWGASSNDWSALVAGMFTGFVVAATSFRFVGTLAAHTTQ